MFAVVVFPGSNCDHDCYHVLKHVLGKPTEFVWHKAQELPRGTQVVVLPGGFSYGDYLRTGAIARFSPIMKAVQAFAQGGGLVLGICNGFQILLEAGLLPGAMLRNNVLRFVCKDVHLRVERTDTPFTNLFQEGQVIRIPIAHMEGNYFIAPEGLETLKAQRRVLFRYCDPQGRITDGANPNGSVDAIAGILNARGNVLGMMPHPERCAEAILGGGTDGLTLFQSILSHLGQRL